VKDSRSVDAEDEELRCRVSRHNRRPSSKKDVQTLPWIVPSEEDHPLLYANNVDLI
jgi:hypothetical protein